MAREFIDKTTDSSVRVQEPTHLVRLSHVLRLRASPVGEFSVYDAEHGNTRFKYPIN